MTSPTVSDLIIDAIQNLPSDPQDLLKQGWQDVTHPDARANPNYTSTEYQDPVTGLKVRFDPATPNADGWNGRDHYHVYNPNSISRRDRYLDINGNVVGNGSNQSHIAPSN